MNWNILGIEETKDKAAITAAYRGKLRSVHPEEDPEGFKALRAAYEEALKRADREEEVPKRDESPVGLWLEKVAAVYDDFKSRLDPDKWTELLNDEVLLALDLRPEAEERLFRYLMEHWYLPQEAWKKIYEAFAVEERKEEFYGAYGRDFIDYAVTNGAMYEPTLPYDLFDPGEDARACDAYRSLYNEAKSAENDRYEAILQELMALPERHPYGEVLRYRAFLGTEKDDDGRSGLKQLAINYPDDTAVNMAYADLCLADENYQEAEPIADHLLSLDWENTVARIAKARCVFLKGDADRAKKLIYDMIDTVTNGNALVNRLHDILRIWNEKLIVDYEAKEDKTQDEWIKLGWCYLQNDMIDEGLAMTKELKPKEIEDLYTYHNFMAKILYSAELHDQVIPHLDWICDYLKSLPDPDPEEPGQGTDEKTGTEEADAAATAEEAQNPENLQDHDKDKDKDIDPLKRKLRLPEFMQMKADMLLALGRTEEGEAMLEQVLKISPNDCNGYLRLGLLAASRKDYEKALEHFTRSESIDSEVPIVHYHKARMLYELRRDKLAFDEINWALDLDGSQLAYYALKIDILMRNEAYEPVRDLLAFFKRNGLSDHLMVAWYEAWLMEEEERKEDEALALYREVERRLDAGEYMDKPDRLFYNICYLEGNKRDPKNNPEDLKVMLDILDKGLQYDSDNPSCLYYKAWLYKVTDQREKALEILKKVEAFPIHTINIERMMAEIYYKNLSSNGEQALYYYQKVRDAEPDEAVNYFYLGTCCRYLDRYEEGKQYFMKELELDPDDVDAYKGLSFIYEFEKDYEKTLEMLEKMVSMTGDAERRAGLHYRRYRIYSRMGKVKEAIKALDETEKTYDAYYIPRAKFDLYTMAGMWDEARKVLADWGKSGEDMKVYYDRMVGFYLMQEDIPTAKAFLKKYKRRMDPDQADQREYEFYMYEGNTKKMILYWTKRYKADKSDRSNTALKLALFYGRLRNTAKAKKYAEEALDMLREELSHGKTSEALWTSRMALALYLTGEKDEAYAMCRKVETLPLCEHCCERGCKDALIYEMDMAELDGDLDRAIKIAEDSLAVYPHETDFLLNLHRLKMKAAEQKSI